MLKMRDWKNSLPDKLWPVIAVIVVIIVFIPSINYDFLLEWDDCHYINSKHMEINPANIRYWLTAVTVKLYTPVTSLSLMIDHALFGNTSPTGYHLHNLLLHCGSVLLFIGIMKQLRISPLIAAGVALLWAIHPQRVPSVVWMSERKDVLVVFFALASMYTYVKACKKKQFSIASPVLLLLSLGAKPAAIGLPVIMLIYTLWRHRKSKWREVRLLIPPFVTLILYFCWFFYVQSFQSPIAVKINLLQKIWVVTHNVMWYLYSGFVPFQLNPLYPMVSPLSMNYLPLICGFILLFGVLCTAFLMIVRFSLKMKIWLFVSIILCWGVLFAPVSGIISIGAADYSDRYNYLLSIVMWLMFALFIAWGSQKKWVKDNQIRKIAPFALLFVLACYWHSNWSYMSTWTNSEKLFLRAVQLQYPNPRAIDALGTVGIHKNKPQLLEIASEKYLTLVLAGDKLPFYPYIIHRDPWLHSGLFLGAYALFVRGKTKEAFSIFVKLERLAKQGKLKFYFDNDYANTFWSSLASCYMASRRPKEALSCLKNQLHTLKPGSSYALFNQGLTAFIKRDFASAEKYWQAARVLNPNNKKVVRNLEMLKKIQAKN